MRIKIPKVVFSLHSDSPVKWKEIKDFNFEDEDEVRVEFVEGYYSEDNSWDDHFKVTITRDVLETDEECKERINRAKRYKEELKERRKETYLKLKKEFENE